MNMLLLEASALKYLPPVIYKNINHKLLWSRYISAFIISRWALQIVITSKNHIHGSLWLKIDASIDN